MLEAREGQIQRQLRAHDHRNNDACVCATQQDAAAERQHERGQPLRITHHTAPHVTARTEGHFLVGIEHHHAARTAGILGLREHQHKSTTQRAALCCTACGGQGRAGYRKVEDVPAIEHTNRQTRPRVSQRAAHSTARCTVHTHVHCRVSGTGVKMMTLVCVHRTTTTHTHTHGYGSNTEPRWQSAADKLSTPTHLQEEEEDFGQTRRGLCQPVQQNNVGCCATASEPTIKSTQRHQRIRCDARRDPSSYRRRRRGRAGCIRCRGPQSSPHTLRSTRRG